MLGKEKKSEGKILSGLRARLYLTRRNNLQWQEERGEVRQTGARIINAGVALAAANVSRRVGSATSSNSSPFPPTHPLPNSSPLLTTVFFFHARSSSPNYCRASLNFSLFFFFLPWRIHGHASAILEMKARRNHPDSCPATEPLRLPDKAVRAHFGSSGQSKLALPFTINKRQRCTPLPTHPPSPSPCQNSAAEAPKCALSRPQSFRAFLCVRLVSIGPTWRDLVRYISGQQKTKTAI